MKRVPEGFESRSYQAWDRAYQLDVKYKYQLADMLMRTRILVPASILLACVVGAPVAVATEHEALIGWDYASARKILIKDHWVPVHRSEIQTMEHDRKIQKKYPEMDSCAMDKPVCSFSFKKAGKCMRIITWGEEMKSFTVNTITNECLDDAKR